MINLLISLLVTNTYSLDCTTEKITEKKELREIQYINGVNTDFDKASRTESRLNEELKVKIDLNYNTDKGLVLQGKIAYNQIIRNRSKFFANPNEFDKVILEYRKDLLSRQDVSNNSIIIGHSQGSLFGNEFCEQGIVEFNKFNIKGIFIGSPVSNHYCPGVIINNPEDPIPDISTSTLEGVARVIDDLADDGAASHDVLKTYLNTKFSFLSKIKESFKQTKLGVENYRSVDNKNSFFGNIVMEAEQKYSEIQLMYKSLNNLASLSDGDILPYNRDLLARFDDSTENYVRKITKQMSKLNQYSRYLLSSGFHKRSFEMNRMEKLLLKEEEVVKYISTLDKAKRLEQYSCDVLGSHFNDVALNKYQKIDAAEKVIKGNTYSKKPKAIIRNEEPDMMNNISSPYGAFQRGI